MEMTVEQVKLKLRDFEYKFYSDEQLIFIAKANRTVFPNLRRIYLYDNNEKELFCLKQTDIIRFIISCIPIIGDVFNRDCPYDLFYQKRKIGYFIEKYVPNSIKGNVENNNYYVYPHTGNSISIFKNDKQVVSIKRNPFKTWDADRYKVFYEKEVSDELIALLVVLADVTWETEDSSTSAYSYEYNWYIGGRKENKNWIPES